MAVTVDGRGRSTAQSRRNFRDAMVFLSPWLVGMVGLWLIPTALSLYFAFTDYTGSVWPPHFIGFANFTNMFDGTDPDFPNTMTATLWWVTFSVPATLIVGLLLALALNMRVKGIGFYRTLVFMPSLVPFVGSTLLFLWMLNPQYGLVNQVLLAVHLPSLGWFTDPVWARPALLLQYLWGSGSTMIIFLAGLQTVPLELHEAASLDGAGPLGRFWHVTLPLLTPTIYFNLLLGLINAVQYFAQAFVASTGTSTTDTASELGGPVGATLVIGLHIYDQAFQQGNVGYASALSWLLVLIVVAITLVLVKTSGRWVHYGH